MIRRNEQTVARPINGRSPYFYSIDLPAWYEDAVCAQTDPESFFPEKGRSSQLAKKICQGCPVANQCLAYAIENDEQWGVWGGLGSFERAKLMKRRIA
jgi:WhiB family redox-sensing transcriptional regulator